MAIRPIVLLFIVSVASVVSATGTGPSVWSIFSVRWRDLGNGIFLITHNGQDLMRMDHRLPRCNHPDGIRYHLILNDVHKSWIKAHEKDFVLEDLGAYKEYRAEVQMRCGEQVVAKGVGKKVIGSVSRRKVDQVISAAPKQSILNFDPAGTRRSVHNEIGFAHRRYLAQHHLIESEENLKPKIFFQNPINGSAIGCFPHAGPDAVCEMHLKFKIDNFFIGDGAVRVFGNMESALLEGHLHAFDDIVRIPRGSVSRSGILRVDIFVHDWFAQILAHETLFVDLISPADRFITLFFPPLLLNREGKHHGLPPLPRRVEAENPTIFVQLRTPRLFQNISWVSTKDCVLAPSPSPSPSPSPTPDIVLFYCGESPSPPKFKNQIWINFCPSPFATDFEDSDEFDFSSNFHSRSSVPLNLMPPNLSMLFAQDLYSTQMPKRGIMVLISSCGFYRDYFIGALMDLISVDSYGTCLHNIDIPADVPASPSVGLNLMSRYKFVLVFERTYTDNFVSEMFFLALAAGSVPIYLGASNVPDFAPKKSFVDVRKYGRPALLAAYIDSISDKDYSEYQQWRSEWRDGGVPDHLKNLSLNSSRPASVPYTESFISPTSPVDLSRFCKLVKK